MSTKTIVRTPALDDPLLPSSGCMAASTRPRRHAAAACAPDGALGSDVDGTHIAGLLCNFLHVCAPACSASSPTTWCGHLAIRVTLSSTTEELGFYSQVEYDRWRRRGSPTAPWTGHYSALGTSSAALAQYFRQLAANTIVLAYRRAVRRGARPLLLRRRADDRKAFLLERCAPDAYVDHAQPRTTLCRFVEDELLPQYAWASVRRGILGVRRLNASLGKVFFGARALRRRG